MKTLPLLSSLLILTTLTACGIDDAPVMSGDEVTAEADGALSVGRFETFTGRDGKFYFHLIAGNGEKVLYSQGYTTLASAKNGVASIKTNGTDASKFLLREASDGAWYFVVLAGNGQIIGASEMYVSQSNATRGMTSTANVVRSTLEQMPAVTGNARFETFRGLDSKYYFHVRALNGEIVIQSQGYTTRASALNGAASVQTNGSSSGRYQILPAADGTSYFVLRAVNGQIIGRSETYVSATNAQRAVVGCVELLSAPLPK